MSYTKVNFTDKTTPLDAANLGILDDALADQDERIVNLSDYAVSTENFKAGSIMNITNDMPESASTNADIMVQAAYVIHNNYLPNGGSICSTANWYNNAAGAAIIGSRYSASRGRYLVLPRLSETIYSVRITDTGASYVEFSGTAATWTP